MKARLAVPLVLCVGVLGISGTASAQYSPGGGAEVQGKIGSKKRPFDNKRVPPRVEKALGGHVEVTPTGIYRVDVGSGPDVFTHGPDPVPPELRKDRPPGYDPLAHSKYGNEAIRAPQCAASVDGDYYQHLIYMHATGTTDHWSTVAPEMVEEMFQINYALNRDSVASGGPSADYKVLCGGPQGDQVVVSDVQSTAPATFNGVTTALRNQGFNKQNVDYTIFYDGDPTVPQCGVGGFFSDESLSANNINNLGNNHGITWVGCWENNAFNATTMHENGHNQGAVQYNAPHSTGDGAHCFDNVDVMCYNDGGDLDPGPPLSPCANPAPANEIPRYDCGFDTYFDSAPENGEYLANNWNIGSPLNRFIVFGAGGGGNQPPSAAFTYNCNNLSCQFTDTSTDDVGIASRDWDFGDGGSSTATNPSHTYSSSGTYTVTLDVTDTPNGAADSVQVPITVSDGAPTTLFSGVPESRTAGAQDTFDRFKIRVPRSAKKITIKTSGQQCSFVSPDLCVPDLDLYVAIGFEPDLDNYHCRPFRYGINERCVRHAPGIKGTHHIGVYNFAAAPGTPYTIKATVKR